MDNCQLWCRFAAIKYNVHIGLTQQNDKLEFVELAWKRHGFPRGEAVERSETDEERRNRPILHTVRKKRTI